MDGVEDKVREGKNRTKLFELSNSTVLHNVFTRVTWCFAADIMATKGMKFQWQRRDGLISITLKG